MTADRGEDELPDGIVVPDDLSSLFGGDGGDGGAVRGEPADAAESGEPAEPAEPAVIHTTAVVLTSVRQAKVLA